MDKFLILNYGSRQLNDSEFNVINAIMNFHFGYPNSTGTERYAEPIVHPNGELVAISIMPAAEPFLSDSQKQSLILQLPADWDQ